jgi:hypothetical protein
MGRLDEHYTSQPTQARCHHGSYYLSPLILLLLLLLLGPLAA